jgi:hypothetical protein
VTFCLRMEWSFFKYILISCLDGPGKAGNKEKLSVSWEIRIPEVCRKRARNKSCLAFNADIQMGCPKVRGSK